MGVAALSAAAVPGAGQNWAQGETWKPIAVLLGIVLLLRLLGIAWLLRSQIGWRSRAVAGERRREIRGHFADDASQRQYALRQLDLGYPRHLLASGLELLFGVLVVGGMTVLMHIENIAVPKNPIDRRDLALFRFEPPYPSTWLSQAFQGRTHGGATTLLICLVLALLWLGAWYRTRYLLHVVHTPSGTWERSRLRRTLWPQLAVRFLAALLLLPVLGIATLLLWQLVALRAARRFHGKRPMTTPLPVIGRPVATGPVVSQLWTGPAAFPPAHTGPPVPAPAAAPISAPYANLPNPGSVPTPPASPTAPATAPPPRPATAPATRAPDPAPAPVVRCSPLGPHEPRTLGPYRLLGRIGAGGMGTVYVACLEGSATQVALKTLKPELLDDPELAQRFQREAEALGRVSSAYTARVIDSGIADGLPFIAMDLLDGAPLDAHLSRRGPILAPEALNAFALALAVALDGVHRSGLVHRDLKPANIMLTTAGPRLLDFGIAVMLDRTRLTRTGMGIGTLPYMAPEQFGEEPAGPWTDVWAWGCCLVAATAGRSPFQARDTAAILNRVLIAGPDETALATLGQVSPELLRVVRLALTRDSAQRPADGNALLLQLLPGAQRPPDLGERITRGWRTLHLG
ncbi:MULTISPECIES: serine/threonine-protein kinase [Streptacidiphilus]|uniref:Serine/threonine-protein kinase n=1 Tax=Streptacidiphilus cavernicola TaxID=3342716 RepID=A0ABV6UU39_9ACTN|nr:serine/threonine-protein kinase [Streptacidiphilus jeojiense]